MAVVIATGIRQTVGYGAVIYWAALAGIPPPLYEAAVVDAASRWQQIRHVTLPALLPTIGTLFILNFAYVLNGGFDQIYNLYNPMVYDVPVKVSIAERVLNGFESGPGEGLKLRESGSTGAFKNVPANRAKGKCLWS